MAYKAFISSTYIDLKSQRRIVIDALRNGGIGVDPMENWTAASHEPKELSQARTKDCDLCVLLVGYRRGHIPESENESITQLEYRAAKQKMSVLVFLLEEGSPWPSEFDERDRDPMVVCWRQELAEHNTCGFFTQEPESLKIKDALLRWLLEKHLQELAAAAPEGLLQQRPWLEQYAAQLEELFSSHMAGFLPGQVLTLQAAREQYVELFAQDRSQRIPHLIPVGELPNQQHGRWLLLGDGGTGKTAALLHLASDLARQAVSDPTVPVPFYARLTHFDRQDNAVQRLLELLGGPAGLEPSKLKEILRGSNRRVLLLLDGFSEIAPQFQPACTLGLQELFRLGTSRAIVSSRPVPSLASIKAEGELHGAELLPLNNDQVAEFLMRNGLEWLVNQLDGDLRKLAGSPFLLRAITASVGGREKRIPRNRGELLRHLIDDRVFGEWEPCKVPPPTRYHYERVKVPVLGGLALRMAQRGVNRIREDLAALREIREQLFRLRTDYEGLVPLTEYELMPDLPSAKDLIDELVYNGVLRRWEGALEFTHRSVQEYFRAMAALNSPLSLVAEVPSLVWRFVEVEREGGGAGESHPCWRPAIILAGLLTDNGAYLRAVGERNPLLLAECIAASANAPADVISLLQADASRMTADLDPRRRWMGCRCLELAPVRDAATIRHITHMALSDSVYFVNIAASHALVSIGPEHVDAVVAAAVLEDSIDVHRDTRIANLLYRLRSPLIAERLFDLWRNGATPESCRNRLKRFLGALKPASTQALERIREDENTDPERRLQAKQCLRDLPSWGAGLGMPGFPVEFFAEVANQIMRRSREEVAVANAQVAELEGVKLIECLRDPGFYIRRAAVIRLERLRTPDALESLVDAIRREPDVSFAASIASAALACAQNVAAAVRCVLQTLAKGDEVPLFSTPAPEPIRAGAVPAWLAQAFQANGRPVMLDARIYPHGADWKIRRDDTGRTDAAAVPDEYSIKQAAGTLSIACLHARARLVRALGSMKSEEAAAVLLPYADHDDEITRAAAIYSLGQWNDSPLHRQVLSDHLRDRSPRVRAVAAGEMARMRGECASELLQSFSCERDPRVVLVLIDCLGKTRSVAAIHALIDALLRIDPPEEGKQETAWGQCNDWTEQIHRALVELDGSNLAQDLLVKALEHTEAGRRAMAAQELARWMRREVQVGPAVWIREREPRDERLADVALSDGDELARRAAAKSLRWSACETIPQRFREALKAAKSELRANAAVAIGLFGDTALVDSLKAALADANEDPFVRLAAAEALGVLMCESAIACATEVATGFALSGESVPIRRRAGAVLSRIPGAMVAYAKPVADSISAGDSQATIRLTDERLVATPENPALRFARGSAYARMDRFEEAKQDLEIAAHKDGYFGATANATLALVLSKLGQQCQALEKAHHAVRLAPEAPHTHAALGDCAFLAGDFAESAAALERAVNLDPSDGGFVLRLAIAKLAAGSTEGVQDLFMRSVDALSRMPPKSRFELVEHAKELLAKIANRREVANDVHSWSVRLAQLAEDPEHTATEAKIIRV